MATFQESGMEFTFSSKNWAVRKYDVHTYYKGLSGAGLKGMDFVGLWNDRFSVLIEVKNYLGPPSLDPKNAEVVAGEITRKTHDTLMGLDAIRQMLERKWLYRLAQPMLNFVPARRYDWPFWEQVTARARYNDQVIVVLVMEGVPEEWYPEIETRLSEQLEKDAGKVHVVGSGIKVLEGLCVSC